MTNKTFELINSIQNRYLISAAQCGAYEKWTDDSVTKEIREVFNNNGRRPIISNISVDDLKSLTFEQLEILGFRRWDTDENWMVPLYLLKYLKQDDEYTCIDGSKEEVKDFDTDNRAGLLAYYFTIKQEPTEI
jgi:hypothetical protein